jgi:hypothetical protein
MKKIQLFILNCLIIALSSCDSFLDIVPDDIATIDNAFTMRAQAEKYLFTCYYYLPAHGLLEANPAIAGGDELYITESFRSAAHVHALSIVAISSGTISKNESHEDKAIIKQFNINSCIFFILYQI